MQGVGVEVDVGVGVGVNVAVGVGVGVNVAVAVGVGVGLAVAVAVGVGLAVGLGLACPDGIKAHPPVGGPPEPLQILIKACVVSLHSRCGRCVAPAHCAVEHVKACLPLVQPQLEVGAATPREILCAPLDVEDAIRRSATYRCEYAEPAINQIQIVPVWVDRVVVGGPRQALVGEGGVRSHELRIAVR